MSPLAILLVLAAACFHAFWNRLLHITGDRTATMAVANVAGGLLLLPAIMLNPPAAVLLLVLASAIAETAYALFLGAAYERGALSVAYPLGRGTAPLLVTLGGWAVLMQRPAPWVLVGAVALATGMAAIAMSGQRAGQGGAVGFALLTGCAIASYSVIDARAVRDTEPLGYLGAVLLLTGVFLAARIGGNRARLRAALGPGVRVAVGSAAAYALVLIAFQQADAGRVSTLRETSVLIGIVLANERPPRTVWTGAILVVAGGILAALG